MRGKSLWKEKSRVTIKIWIMEKMTNPRKIPISHLCDQLGVRGSVGLVHSHRSLLTMLVHPMRRERLLSCRRRTCGYNFSN
ncbi:hypothetical protein V6Z12_D08G031100 [Gossypium hirsutum]